MTATEKHTEASSREPERSMNAHTPGPTAEEIEEAFWAADRALASKPQASVDVTAIRRQTIEECAAHIRSGAGMASLIDDELLDLQANGLLRALASQPAPAGVDWKAFAKELSDALLAVRPLGGSEMFVKRGDDYFADPEYCRKLIEKLRDDLDNCRLNSVRAMLSAAPAAQKSGVG